MKQNRTKKVKIWWRIPDLEEIPTEEARELIYRSMQVASDAFYYYNEKMEEPNFFKTFWLITEADRGVQMLNYMIRRMNDSRVKYFAEVRK